MRQVEMVYAGNVEEEDVLVNMGEVTRVCGGGSDVVLIEWRGPWSNIVGTHVINGKTFTADTKLYRFPREDED